MRKRLSLPPIIAVTMNFVLFFVKFYIGIRTNCLCIYTDSINNLADTGAALLALLGIYLMTRPATKKYPFGKGRTEYAASFLMAILMTGAGFLFAYNSIERFFAPTPVWFFVKYAVIIGATCLVKLILGVIFSLLYKKDHSPVTKALVFDSFTDCGITLVALVSFTLTNYTEFIIDAYLGLFISIIISVLGIKLIISSFGNLIGKTDEALMEKIEMAIKNIDNTIEIISISVHNYGVEKNIVSLTLSGNKNLQKEIKNVLRKKLSLESTVEWEDKP